MPIQKITHYTRNIYRLGGALVAATMICSCTSSCDSFVEVDQPGSQLTATAVFDSKVTATAALVDIYAQIREGGMVSGKAGGLSVLLGCYADELTSYENGGYTSEAFYKNALLPSNPRITTVWNTAYNQIYAANAIAKGVVESNLAAADKEQLEGEALFVRGLLHFFLANLFGDVPYITGTDYTLNSTVRRMPKAEVYSQIIADLEKAVTQLPEAYVTPNRMRPNRATAQALLARVYLYNGQYSGSSNMASAVLNQENLYVWETDLDKIFLKQSTTTIWQLAPAYEGQNTGEGLQFIFTAGPPLHYDLNPALLGAFEPGDQRRSHWVATVTDAGNSWYHAFKYKQQYDTGTTLETSIVFRLAEMYLIRAEARARQGELVGAVEDLNKIRHTAGLGDTPAQTKEAIVEAVLQERRVELFTEQGHRFFDLKRCGLLDSQLSSKAGWNPTDALWPLPQPELLANPYLTPQNPGY